MHKRITNDELTSAMFQTIMILTAYQKAFDFTHNDLHTNNIMYIETDEPYLYYCYENTHYKVPTHGRIFKLIDFGRAIYRFNGKLFCSDSFAPNNDAHTQYNCEPYMNENKPRIDPNPSFDLTRLGCSIYDFIFEDFEPGENIPEIHKIIWEWCMDDSGKSVVYKKAGQERYPGFKLYKMIARAVHKHVPKEQLKRPLFAAFKDVANPAAFNVDLIPRYMVATIDK
jgi:serine/threonine protein kinase